MKILGRVLAYSSAALIALTPLEIKNIPMMTIWPIRLLVSGWAPWIAAAGSLGAMIAAICKDSCTVFVGLLGALFSARHIKRISAPHNGFAHAFGPDWEQQISPPLAAQMLRTRWPNTLDLPDVPYMQDVTCGTATNGVPLLCDLWEPPDGMPRTGLAVIFLHGSGWHYGDKDLRTRSFFRYLAGQGHVIMDVAYTLWPGAQLHGQVSDVKHAIAWMKANAGQYGIDPAQIVLMGGSAGGHLALLAAYTPNHPELDPEDLQDVDTSVRAVVSYYGPADLRAVHRTFVAKFSDWPADDAHWLNRFSKQSVEDASRIYPPADLVPQFLGGLPDEVPGLYDLGSPINHIGPHCPPTLQFVGSRDFAVRPEPLRALHTALRDADVPSIYVEFPDCGHGFDLVPGLLGVAGQAALYDVERFLALVM